MKLMEERKGDELKLRAVGRAEADELLSALAIALDAAGPARRLSLDLSALRGLDNLCVSVLVVELRSHEDRFDRMRLYGLPKWAERRLRQRGAQELPGPGWSRMGQEGPYLAFTRGVPSGLEP